MELQVVGAEQFAALSRRLKDAEETGLSRELNRALTSAAAPARDKVLAHLPVYLPNRYAEVLQPTLRIRTSRRSGRNAGVRIVATAKGPRKERFVGPLDAGRLRHPRWGDRRHWYDQRVKPGFFTEPLKGTAPEIRQNLIAAMERIAEQIAH